MDTDRRSIRVSKPIATAANLELFATDNLVPSNEYAVIYDPETLTINQPRMLYFNYKWRSIEDRFEVSYNTVRGFCTKCAGLGSLDDMSWGVDGQLATIRDEKLLLQNMEKFVVTELGSNPFHTFLGTGLTALLGKRLSDFNFTASQITQEIYGTLNKFRDMQQQYAKTGRPITKGEQIDQVLDVKVTQSTSDPTIVMADVRFTALSGNYLNFTQYLQIQ